MYIYSVLAGLRPWVLAACGLFCADPRIAGLAAAGAPLEAGPGNLGIAP